MSSANVNLSSIHGLGEADVKPVKLEPDLGKGSLQSEENKRLCALSTSHSVRDQGPSPIDNSTLCSTSSLSPAPISRQFWNAGNYDDTHSSKSNCQNGTGYLRIHPKFLHSNATSHKWAFGAIAELLDNAVDEVQNGATFVIVDKTLNPRDGTPALMIQDDGGGMDPEAMRRCLSFGFSDKKSKTTIGHYGNGFKTSSMRLGADVVVLSRCKNRKWTQSVGLLSYTFLMQTGHDRIVVPMVDYQFNEQTATWNSVHDAQHHKNNLSILLQWSPFAREAEILKECDGVGAHGTKIIIYNLWHNDEGKTELNFESDPEDICLSNESTKAAEKAASRMLLSEQHLANRLRHSLRAYLSILYLRIPQNFSILLRGRIVNYHNIANDLKYPEFILYRPHNVEGQVITTIGFLKEAPNVNIHGFNVYHKNRLILPFWHVVSYSDSRGRGVVGKIFLNLVASCHVSPYCIHMNLLLVMPGVLEANFIKPTHNKQEFEKTAVFQKLESRLKEMTQEYWDYHCGLLGYQQPKKKPRPMNMSQPSSDSRLTGPATYQPVLLSRDSSGAVGSNISARIGAIHHKTNSSSHCIETKPVISAPSLIGMTMKRKGRDDVVESERLKRTGLRGPRTTEFVQHAANQLDDQETATVIQENQKLQAQCREHEKTQDELNLKATRLRAEIEEAKRKYARLLLESKLLERVKWENRQVNLE